MAILLYSLVGAILLPHYGVLAAAAWLLPSPMPVTSVNGVKTGLLAAGANTEGKTTKIQVKVKSKEEDEAVVPVDVNPIAALFGGPAVTIYAVPPSVTAAAVEAQTVTAAAAVPTLKDKHKHVKISIKAKGEEAPAVVTSPLMIPAVDPVAALFDDPSWYPVFIKDAIPPTVAPPVLVTTNPEEKGKNVQIKIKIKGKKAVPSPVVVPTVDPVAALFDDPSWYPVFNIDAMPSTEVPPVLVTTNPEEKGKKVQIKIKTKGEKDSTVVHSPDVVPTVDPVAALFGDPVWYPVFNIDEITSTVAPPVLVTTNPEEKGKKVEIKIKTKGKKASAVVPSPVMVSTVNPVAALFDSPVWYPAFTIDAMPATKAPQVLVTTNQEERGKKFEIKIKTKGKKGSAVVPSPVVDHTVLDPVGVLFDYPGFPVPPAVAPPVLAPPVLPPPVLAPPVLAPPVLPPPVLLTTNLEEKTPEVVSHPFMDMVVGTGVPTFIIKDPSLEAIAAVERPAAVDALSAVGLIGWPMDKLPMNEAWWLRKKYLTKMDWRGVLKGDSDKLDNAIYEAMVARTKNKVPVPSVALFDEFVPTSLHL